VVETQELCQGVTIKIEKISVDTDPYTHVFEVTILAADGSGEPMSSWGESTGSEEWLKGFLRGLQAGSAMCRGRYVHVPRVPMYATRTAVPVPEPEAVVDES